MHNLIEYNKVDEVDPLPLLDGGVGQKKVVLGRHKLACAWL